MGRTKDSFWSYVVVEANDRFRCKFCSRVFAGGIPRIKSHLSGVNCRGIAVCTEVPKEVQVAARSVLEGTSLDKGDASSDVEINGKTMSTSSQLVKRSRPHSSPNVCEKDQVVVHTELARFLMSNRIGFDAVESRSFIDFVKGVAGCGLKYKLPSSEALKTEFVPNLKKEVEDYVKDVRESWARTGCTVMLDIGTKSINLYAYCPKGVVFLGSHKIRKCWRLCQDATQIVAAAIEEIGADHVVQFITNNSTLFCFEEMLGGRFPRIYTVECASNVLRSVFEELFQDVEFVETRIYSARTIVNNIYGDVALLSLMKRYTDNRELKHPSCCGPASNYEMLQTIMHNEVGLRQLVESEEWESLAGNKTVRATEVESIVKDQVFWKDGRILLKALEPLIQVLCLVEDSGATSGYLYASMKMARKAIQKLCHNNDVVSQILEIFDGVISILFMLLQLS